MTVYMGQLADTFIDKAREDLLLTLSGGFVKIRLMEAALSLGWTLQEGTGDAAGKKTADIIRLTPGSLKWKRSSRVMQLPAGSADLAILKPIQGFVEKKTRPDIGAKARAQFDEMIEDVDRVATNAACSFFFVLDEKIYRSFSGEKRERRGRPSSNSDWFIKHFEPETKLADPGWFWSTISRRDTPISLGTRRFRTVGGFVRTLVVGARDDSVFAANVIAEEEALEECL